MATAPKPKPKVKPRPEGKYLIPGSNSGKMSKALQKPKLLIAPGRSKSQAEIDKIFGSTAIKKTSRGPVTGTGTSSGSGKTPNLPKSTKMSESAKPKATSKPKPKGPYEKDYMKPPKTEKKKK